MITVKGLIVQAEGRISLSDALRSVCTTVMKSRSIMMTTQKRMLIAALAVGILIIGALNAPMISSVSAAPAMAAPTPRPPKPPPTPPPTAAPAEGAADANHTYGFAATGSRGGKLVVGHSGLSSIVVWFHLGTASKPSECGIVGLRPTSSRIVGPNDDPAIMEPVLIVTFQYQIAMAVTHDSCYVTSPRYNFGK